MKKAFTLIELLVVVAVIALLAVIIVVNFTQTKAKARDAKREVEIQSLMKALALYNETNGYFPNPYSDTLIDGSDEVSLFLIPDFLSQAVVDPRNDGSCPPNPYVYCYSSADGNTYTITYFLETNSIPGKSGEQQVGP